MLSTSKLDADDAGYEKFKHENALTSKTAIAVPPLGIYPADFVSKHFGPRSEMQNVQFYKGTTTLAFIYESAAEGELPGVIIAVDSRASAGEYIASSTVMKVLDISDKMVATMAGGAADCQFWSRVVGKYCKLFELREKKEISVRAASKYMANVLYGYRNHGLSVYSTVAGVDSRGPSIFSVTGEGQRLEHSEYFSTGSGCLAAYGFLDTHYKRKMSVEEAINLGRRAIMHATYRDGGSGGQCTVVHITANGKKYHGPFDVSDMFYEFSKHMGIDTTGTIKADD